MIKVLSLSERLLSDYLHNLNILCIAIPIERRFDLHPGAFKDCDIIDSLQYSTDSYNVVPCIL